MALASKRELIDVSSVRDGHRLLCLSFPLNGAWLSCTPSTVDNLAIRDAEFRSLVKYRLGLPILPPATIGTPCPFCQAPVGDHCLNCSKSRQWARHNAVRDFLHQTFQKCGSRAEKEKTIEGSLRPAARMGRKTQCLHRRHSRECLPPYHIAV